MKKLSKLLGLALSAVMMATVASYSGSMVSSKAAVSSDAFYAFDSADHRGSNSAYASNGNIEINDVTWNFEGNMQQLPWRLGGKGASAVNRSLKSTTSISRNVGKIDVKIGTSSVGSLNSLSLVVSATEDFTGDPIYSETKSSISASSTVTFTSSEYNWANAYYKFTFNVTLADSNSNKFVEFVGLSMYEYTEDSAEPLPSEADDDLNDIEPYFSLAYKYERTVNVPENASGVVNINSGGLTVGDGGVELTTSAKFASSTPRVSNNDYNCTITLPSGVTFGSGSKVYNGRNDTLKFGSSSANGSLVLNSANRISSVRVGIKAYNTAENENEISINGQAPVLATSKTDETFVDATINSLSLTITSTLRVYVTSIQFNFDVAETITYSDVDFRLRVGIDEMETFAAVYDMITSYGVEVSTASKTKKYYFNENTPTKENGNIQYTIIDLGDAFENPTRFEEEFTIRAFFIYNTNEHYSEFTKTASIKSLVGTYHSDPNTAPLVEHLYSYLYA